jgi:hypothetical protein
MRRFRLAVTSFAGAALLAVAGCGGPSHAEGCSGDASLFISWSFGTEPPATACAARGVDHLEVTVESATCPGIVIAPVLCTLDRFRYDRQRSGPAVVGVAAVDANGRILASGAASMTLAPTIPSTPNHIILR